MAHRYFFIFLMGILNTLCGFVWVSFFSTSTIKNIFSFSFYTLVPLLHFAAKEHHFDVKNTTLWLHWYAWGVFFFTFDANEALLPQTYGVRPGKWVGARRNYHFLPTSLKPKMFFGGGSSGCKNGLIWFTNPQKNYKVINMTFFCLCFCKAFARDKFH